MYQLPTALRPENILIYLRKSRTDDPALSVADVLARHEQLLDDWSRSTLGGTVPEGNRFREVVSGETISARPQMQRLLRVLEGPAPSAILTVEPQRLSRGDWEDAGYLIKILRYTATPVITPVFTYDLADERDRDLFRRELQRGNEFLEYQKRILNRGRLLAVENGCFIGQTPPYGYRKATVRIGKRLCHTLTPDPDEAPVVRLIFQLYLQGLGGSRIADYLESRGIPAPSGQAHWCVSHFRAILTNEHYIGKVRWNHRKTETAIREGQVVKSRPWATDYLLCDGLHPGIVDPALFRAAQQRRGTHDRTRRDAAFANPLAGLLYCRCGRPMLRQSRGSAAARLLCADQRHCHTPSCRMADVLPAIARALAQGIDDFDIPLRTEAPDPDRAALSLLRRRREELQAAQLRQWELLCAGKMPREVFDRLNEKLLSDLARTEEALSAAAVQAPEEPLQTGRFRAALSLLLTPEAPARELNLLLRSCIRRITYSRTRPGGCGSSPIELEVELLL